MLTLSYSACYDPYNTVFRMLAILESSKTGAMLVDVLRICDFFVCFPIRLSEVKPPNSVPGMRKRCNALIRHLPASEFELLPSSDVLFDRMSVIQEAAISAMVANNLAQVFEKQSVRTVQINENELVPKLRNYLDQFLHVNKNLLEVISLDFPKIPLLGSDGLKARTGLGEFEYDTV